MTTRWLGYAAIAVAAGAGGAAASLLLAGGGSGGASSGVAAASSAVSSALPGTASLAPVTCPTVSTAAPQWPLPALKGLPGLNGATISSVQQQDGTLAVQFGVPTSFTGAAALLRTELPAAGYVLFGGDQESREADVRFISGALTGGFKLVDIGPCMSRGILAVVDPSAQPATSASPRP